MNASPSPISRLVLFMLEECAGRGLAIYEQRTENKGGAAMVPVVHFWTVSGRPVLIQETREGGYDLFVPLLDSLDIGETERALRAYAERSSLPAAGRSSASAIEAPESDQALPQGTLDARNAESPSETNLAPNAAVLAGVSDGAENRASERDTLRLAERAAREKIGESFNTQIFGTIPYEHGRCDVHGKVGCPTRGRVSNEKRKLFQVRWQTLQMGAPAFTTVCYEAWCDWASRGLIKNGRSK